MSEEPWKQTSEAPKSDGKPPSPSAEDASKQDDGTKAARVTQPEKKDAPNIEEPIVPQKTADVSSVKDVGLSLLQGQLKMDPGYPLDAGASVSMPLPQTIALPPPYPVPAQTEPARGTGPGFSLATIAFMTQHHVDTSPPMVRLVFNQLEQHTGIHRVYVTMGLGGFFALYMIFGYFAQLLCNLVGFAIPAYASMRAIESTSKQDDTKWLTYWVVFACFSCVDFFADSILRYFPFYWLAKASALSLIIFLVYCFFPSERNGSVVLYSRLIRPYFLQSQGKVDATVKNLASAATTGFESALRK
ncbi:unnamed protein product, partial [Ixodes hexagonus]